MLVIDIKNIEKKFFFMILKFLIISLNVKGIKIIQTINHLKKFNDKGGTS
jgi:hypothetical protein